MNNKLIPVEYSNQRILTTHQLAESYETETRRISENFNANKGRYILGKHYFCLEGEAKREFLNHTQITDGSKNAAILYLWTEKGALLHAKSLNTDKAWEVYGELVENYFNTKVASLDITQLSPQMQLLTQMVNSMAQQELKLNQLEVKIQDTEKQTAEIGQKINIVQDTIIQRDDDWRRGLNKIFNNAVEASGTGDYQTLRQETYEILEREEPIAI